MRSGTVNVPGIVGMTVALEESAADLPRSVERLGVLRERMSSGTLKIPASLIPKCPDDGSDVTMNLRADDSFVEDEGWHRASAAYADFLLKTENLPVLYLELGVGANTPVIYALNPIRPKMAKNSRFYPGYGYFMKELSRITDSERLRAGIIIFRIRAVKNLPDT